IGSVLVDALMLRNEDVPPERRSHVIAVGRNRESAEQRFPLWLDKAEFAFLAHDVGQPFDIIPRKLDYVLHAASNTHPVAYAAERAQFGQKINKFPGVYDMLSRMRAKLDASRSLLYQTSRYVDIYKALEDIQRERKLEADERAEMKTFSRLADAFTPLCKGMASEYANQNAYDAISVHGGSGFIMEYKSQRLYRDARIFSIYEGTTQLQVVAAIRYITNGTYLSIINEMLGEEVLPELVPLKEKIAGCAGILSECIAKVREAGDNEVQDFLARRLYDMTGEIVMSLLLMRDATVAPDMFLKSAKVYAAMAQETVAGKSAYILGFDKESLPAFRVVGE
ncbi:MAG: hypothetical protein IJ840_09610, partial [Bacteroidales bacterium]|nr:hypothetical protein [Bacteroidales bacterium]